MFFNNINKGIEEFRTTPDAVLIDVREPAEFGAGHIPGAVNMPLSSISSISSISLPKDRPIFLYCLRGRRSRQARHILKSLGYERVKSIGGIASYKGETVTE